MTPTETSTVHNTNAPETDVALDEAVLSVKTAMVSRKKRNSIFLPEIVAMALSGVALLGVIFAYVGGYLPAREELRQRQKTRDQLDKQWQELQARSDKFHTKENSVTEVVNSIGRFEETFLPIAAQGNSVLYGRINQLIRANNLRNTAGPEYAPIPFISVDKAAQSERNKKESLFPGTTVGLTVEGSYANLRRFIADLENTRQFLVINAIEIESNGDKTETAGANNNPAIQNQPIMPNNPRGAAGGAKVPNNFPGGTAAGANPNRVQPRLNNEFPNNDLRTTPSDQASKNRGGGGSTISLRLEMAAYFKRPLNVDPTIQNQSLNR